MDVSLSGAEKAFLLAAARETLEAVLEKKEAVCRPVPPGLEASRGVFVTLHTNQGGLRGCIGSLQGSGKNLYEMVKEMALASAFEDPRFPPVQKDEIKKLTIEISILSEFTEALPDDVIPGTHGILVRRGRDSGILLPQVAAEQGWNRIQLLRHGCLKAGLPEESWNRPDTRIWIFTALVFHEEQ